MGLKLADEKFSDFLDLIKPKIKKELSQSPASDREDLEQEMILHVIKILKEKEFEELDFFDLIAEDE